MSSNRITPMIQQFYELKDQAPGALLFFRMGDFYELFGEDATCVAPLLGIVLTAREKGNQTKIPFCGIPHHSHSHHLMKLLRLGYKVAVADQCSTETTGGLMKRHIVRIHTLACTDHMPASQTDESHYLMAAYECPDTRCWLYVLVEYSIGEIRLGVGDQLSDLEGIFEIYKPKELVVRSFQKPLFEPLIDQLKHYDGLVSDLPEGISAADRSVEDQLKCPSWQTAFERIATQAQCICHQSHLSCDDFKSLVSSAQVLLRSVLYYMGSLKASCDHFRRLSSFDQRATMELSEVAIRDLELLKSQRTGKIHGSLWQIIHQCSTSMGSRRLKSLILHPYTDITQIASSHDMITALLSVKSHHPLLKKTLSTCYDLERLAHRLMQNKLGASQALFLKVSLDAAQRVAQQIQDICDRLSCDEAESVKSHLQAWIYDLKGAYAAWQLMDEALADDPSSEGGIFCEGYDEDLDGYRLWLHKGDAHLKNYEQHLRQSLGIASLKIKSHKTMGYLIEITNSHLHKLDDEKDVSDLECKQTMVGSKRFVTSKLKEYAELMSSSQFKITHREQELYTALMNRLAQHYDQILGASRALAQWDVSVCMAVVADTHSFCKPTPSRDTIDLRGSFHPVVAEHMPSHQYTPNSICMNKQKCVLITGPNMGGKSTLMRQVALTAILNQIGSYVPAGHAELPLFDGVYTRVGASDHLAAGQSTFMVEMTETAAILQHATASSLVILDELGRGTSTEDGMALAGSFLKEFASELKSWVFFATHYHELAAQASQMKQVRLMQTEVLRLQGKLHFSYRLIDGVCSHSFGLETARLAGISEHILKEANRQLHAPSESAPTHSPSPENLDESWLEQELKALDPSSLSPLNALHLLFKWKTQLDQKPEDSAYQNPPISSSSSLSPPSA